MLWFNHIFDIKQNTLSIQTSLNCHIRLLKWVITLGWLCMFDRFFTWVRNLFGNAPVDAIASLYPAPPPTSIDNFEQMTRADAPQQLVLMGSLLEKGIAPQQFEALCYGFAQGLRYVENKFGTVPNDIIISDEDARSPRYNVDTQSIFVPRRFIERLITSKLNAQSKTDPLLLTAEEMAAMYGVEEAFHHYQVTQHPERYPGQKNEYLPDGTSRYDELNPLEYDARAIVREAISDFGLLDNAIAQDKATPHNMEWLNEARQEQMQWRNQIAHERLNSPTELTPQMATAR